MSSPPKKTAMKGFMLGADDNELLARAGPEQQPLLSGTPRRTSHCDPNLGDLNSNVTLPRLEPRVESR